MPSRQQLRRAVRGAIPWPVRQRLYDRDAGRKRRWRLAPGVERLSDEGLAALTFDDGPGGSDTRAVLDALSTAGAPATFFVLGEHVLEQPELVHEIRDRGHELALHGMTHRRHDRLEEAEAEEDLRRGMAAIEEVGGQRPRWYRPPFGRPSPLLASICERLELTLVYWTAWGHDWEPVPSSHVARTVLRDLGPGGIALLHDSARYGQRGDARATAAAVPEIAAATRERGLRLVTLSGGANDTP
jgi:peptidoglycan-N-acetylglucosamine deacetylase